MAYSQIDNGSVDLISNIFVRRERVNGDYAQYHWFKSNYGSNGCLHPEYLLWLAVFQLAVNDFTSGDDKLAEKARKWMFDDKFQLGSFNFCCDIFGIHPNYARKRLLKLTKGFHVVRHGRKSDKLSKMGSRVR